MFLYFLVSTLLNRLSFLFPHPACTPVSLLYPFPHLLLFISLHSSIISSVNVTASFQIETSGDQFVFCSVLFCSVLFCSVLFCSLDWYNCKLHTTNLIRNFPLTEKNRKIRKGHKTNRTRTCGPSYRRVSMPCQHDACNNFFANDQLEALFCISIYYTPLHVSSIVVLIIRRSNCINTSSGMISLCKWLLSMPVLTGILSSHLHRLIIPDDVLIKFDLLMMSTMMLETGREV